MDEENNSEARRWLWKGVLVSWFGEETKRWLWKGVSVSWFSEVFDEGFPKRGITNSKEGS